MKNNIWTILYVTAIVFTIVICIWLTKIIAESNLPLWIKILLLR